MGPLEGTRLNPCSRVALGVAHLLRRILYNISEAKIKVDVSEDDSKDSLQKPRRPVTNTDNVQRPD